MLVDWWGRGEEKGRDVRRGEKRGGKGEEMSYHASICVGVQLYWARVQPDRCDYIFLQQNIYNIKSHKTPLWTHNFLDTKRYKHLSINLCSFMLFLRVAGTFKKWFLSSRTKSHSKGAVRLWININKVPAYLNPSVTASPVFYDINHLVSETGCLFFQTTNCVKAF